MEKNIIIEGVAKSVVGYFYKIELRIVHCKNSEWSIVAVKIGQNVLFILNKYSSSSCLWNNTPFI